MAKNVDFGTVTKKLNSGFFESKKGKNIFKIPALNGLKVGDKVKLVEGGYVVDTGESDAPEEVEATDLSSVNEKFKAIEAQLEAMKTSQAEVKKELEAMKTSQAEVKKEA